MEPPVALAFLTDGGQSADSIGEMLAAYIEGAQQTLEIAIYDLLLTGNPYARLLRAVKGAAGRGVRVRVVFNQDHPRPRPLPPPPGYVQKSLFDEAGVESVPIPGAPDLMHHKYVVRDADLPSGAVWSGSTNWTTDSWTREDNVLVRVLSQPLALQFRQDFEELWTKREVAASGQFESEWVTAGQARLRPYFSPGRANKMVHEISERIATASRRIRIASPVLTSGPILGTLTEVLHKGTVDVRGVYDWTQMEEVRRQWTANALSAWKLDAFAAIEHSARFSSKHSTPWGAGSTHDYMHCKMTVADDTVFVGSFNLSHSGEMNAENVIEIEDAGLAELAAGFIDRLIARYGQAPGSVRPEVGG